MINNLLETLKFDAVIIGGGAIGLSVGYKLVQHLNNILILEEMNSPGEITSSRNSEVIHSGIYYKPGSMKARTCVVGREQLYSFIEKYGIGYKKLGKLIVASTDDELRILQDLIETGEQNGVPGLRLLSAAETIALEPNITAKASIFSSETGIFDSHEFMKTLESLILSRGGIIAYKALAKKVEICGSEYGVYVSQPGSSEYLVKTPNLVVANGHGLPELLSNSNDLTTGFKFEHRYAKGSYAMINRKEIFNHLIYPVPVTGALGIHLTMDLEGHLRFGPDIEWTKHYDTSTASMDLNKFRDAIYKYWPGIDESKLIPDYAGVRPKVFVDGELLDDFLIISDWEHSLPNMIVLAGIESPGLTSSLALADEVITKLFDK